jgi:hypothetical protein
VIRLYENTEGFDPETLHMLGEAMDEAWRRAEFVYVDGNDDGARTTIAEYILAVAKKGERDRARLVRGALRRLTLRAATITTRGALIGGLPPKEKLIHE